MLEENADDSASVTCHSLVSNIVLIEDSRITAIGSDLAFPVHQKFLLDNENFGFAKTGPFVSYILP